MQTLNVLPVSGPIADDMGAFVLYALATESRLPVLVNLPSVAHGGRLYLPNLDSHGTDVASRRAELESVATGEHHSPETRELVASVLNPPPATYPELIAAHRAICAAQPGHGTPNYRGDPYDAVAFYQQAERLVNDRARRLVETDVLVCLSGIFADLRDLTADAPYTKTRELLLDVDDLSELAERAPDADSYREAAAYHDEVYIKNLRVGKEGDGWCWWRETGDGYLLERQGLESELDAWRDAFDTLGADTPDGSDIYEHWAVSDYLGARLKERGESVADIAGVTVWGRATTGQMIEMDGVIQDIAKELLA